MNWLENNPVGVALASVCGFLILVSAALGYVWSRPADSGAPAIAVSPDEDTQTQLVINDIGPVSQYREFTDRPLFDQSRKPAVNIEGDGLGLEGQEGEVSDAPDVTLTGVVITPDAKIVTLKPASNEESIIIYEGKPLEGDYSGWSVSEIKPRSVVLASRDGGNLELDLQVNTRRIEEPVKPEPLVSEAQIEATGEPDDQPLTRAEEIRQRIAERREELRRQAEEQEAESATKKGGASSYQSAIQNMINRNRNKDKPDDEKNENGSDG